MNGGGNGGRRWINARSLEAKSWGFLGRNREEGREIYMGGSTWRARRKSQRNRRGFPLGFVRGVRVHHGDVEVMSGGACLSAREKGELGLGRCLLHARGLARWARPS